jgi:manganese/zinc/iron transport system permease protein
MSFQAEIFAIAMLVALACALPGVFLVLRKMALISDAISHSILPGIVVAYFLTRSLHSPLLFVGAVLTGLLTVVLVEILRGTRLVKEDAAIGIVFPALFAVGVILVSRFAGNVHLDVDAVLLGEIAFAPFDRLVLFCADLGPKSMFTMATILVFNLLIISVFYKELKISTFDPGLAASLGFFPAALNYLLMGMVSVTAVGAFESVGSVLVVALMIAPPAAAYLLTDRLSRMLMLSALIAAVSAAAGFALAFNLDISIPGAMAAATGLVFLFALLFAPRRGLVHLWREHRSKARTFSMQMLLVHLLNHEQKEDERSELSRAHMVEHFHWDRDYAEQILGLSQRRGFCSVDNGMILLSDEGRDYAREVMVN